MGRLNLRLVQELAEKLEGHTMGIRTLLEVAELSSQHPPVQLSTFMECLHDASVVEGRSSPDPFEYRFV